MKNKNSDLKIGDMVEFRPIVIGRVYHIGRTSNGKVAYLEFEGHRGYQTPPYKVSKISK